jgi:hypothetical protein
MVKCRNRRNATAEPLGESNIMKRAALLIAFAVPLAGCSSEPTVDETNASVEEVAEKVREASRDDQFIRPGKWLSSVTIEDMNMPGMPAEAADQMKRMMAQTHSSESCLTAEQVKQPKEEFFSGDENCRYDHFRMGGGKIDAAMRCQAGGGTQLMQMQGNYSPDNYEMRMNSRVEGGQGEGMTMRMKVEAKRTGDCTEKKA